MGIKKARRKKRRKAFKILLLICVIGLTGLIVASVKNKEENQGLQIKSEKEAENMIEAYAHKKGYQMKEYPDYMVEMLYHTPEAKEFVLEYPKYKEKAPEIHIENCLKENKVPLFIQWDKEWGYQKYGSSVIGVCGCGPTCLSMVTVYLTKDTGKDPLWMANYSQEHGYYLEGQGTSWSLMMEGAQALGLDVTNIPLDTDRMIANLEAGNPIICSMGPGDFTSSGHFIVLTAYQDGKVIIHDPNSPSRSQKKWDLNQIQSQIKNIWVYR